MCPFLYVGTDLVFCREPLEFLIRSFVLFFFLYISRKNSPDSGYTKIEESDNATFLVLQPSVFRATCWLATLQYFMFLR